MKYLITTFQALGIALVATAALRIPISETGIFIGLWFIFVGFLLNLMIEGVKK